MPAQRPVASRARRLPFWRFWDKPIGGLGLALSSPPCTPVSRPLACWDSAGRRRCSPGGPGVRTAGAVGSALVLVAAAAAADDWPQWRGPGRDGAWHAGGLPGRLPETLP